MLESLHLRAVDEELDIEIVQGRAESPPNLAFPAVVEHLLLWTLPRPEATVVTWRRVAAGERLVCFEGVWGVADKVEALRGRGGDTCTGSSTALPSTTVSMIPR